MRLCQRLRTSQFAMQSMSLRGSVSARACASPTPKVRLSVLECYMFEFLENLVLAYGAGSMAKSGSVPQDVSPAVELVSQTK